MEGFTGEYLKKRQIFQKSGFNLWVNLKNHHAVRHTSKIAEKLFTGL
jgi:hypothetical protein